MPQKNQGNLFIVAAPSGGGKTSLVKELVSQVEHIEISISHTTRKKRPAEVDGVNYCFVDKAVFIQMINEGAFVEHARVFGEYYGTSFAQIESRLQAGIDVLLDIDWQGAQQIKRHFKRAISIFIIPPSVDELKKRLRDRQQDDETVIASRMRSARDELSHYAEFDYLVVNDSFTKAASELRSIVVSNRLQMERQAEKQSKLLSFLLSSR